MSQRAIVNAPTVAIAHTGHAAGLPAGSYEVVDLDGVGEGVTYIKGPHGGDLMCINLSDPAITVVTPGDPFHHPDLPAGRRPRRRAARLPTRRRRYRCTARSSRSPASPTCGPAGARPRSDTSCSASTSTPARPTLGRKAIGLRPQPSPERHVMPRTIKSILENHRISQARRDEGRPVWDYTVRLPRVDADEPYETQRNALVAALRDSAWIKRWGSDGGPLDQLVEELADTVDVEEFADVMDAICDYADAEHGRAFLDFTS